MELLEHVYYGNTVRTWMWAVIVFLSLLTALRLVRSLAVRWLSKFVSRTPLSLDDRLVDLLKRTRLFFILAVSIWGASLVLSLSPKVAVLIRGVMVVAVVAQVGIWLTSLVSLVVTHYVAKEIGEGSEAVSVSTALNFIGKLLLWTALLLWALDNLGWKVGPLLAGLGVGGIAVALAAQNLLGDLFASFSILFDKPFVIGDFINVGTESGTVERIGLKTTRLKSLSGEHLVISNADLLKSRIRNFKLMQERRVVFQISVVYQTPYHQVAAIPGMIRKIIEEQREVRFDRSHFARYSDSALTFETVYWVTNPDMTRYMDIQQSINLAIFKKFEEEGIKFAYPTQVVYVAQDQRVMSM